jgi:2,4-dienoyl-CoA reductase-like NADH-dependent reductase (Old Yellow Enzyme family)
VRLSVFDLVPYRPDPKRSTPGKPGTGVPELHQQHLPYRWGFGVNPQDPTQIDLTEPIRLLSMFEPMGLRLANLTAGCPYYNPHIQRPALFPPSDGYRPPEDPLVGVARQMEMVRQLKQQFPNLIVVGSAYTYLQEFLPHVAQGALRQGWVDSVGLGRMVLSYPQALWDVLSGEPLKHRLLCRTFSDCTTAPRKGLPSGCYPLDGYYNKSDAARLLEALKAKGRKA